MYGRYVWYASSHAQTGTGWPPRLLQDALTALEEAFVVVGGRDHASAGGRRGRARGRRRSRRCVIYGTLHLYSTVSVQVRKCADCVFWEDIKETEARSRRDEMYSRPSGILKSGTVHAQCRPGRRWAQVSAVAAAIDALVVLGGWLTHRRRFKWL